MPKILDLPEWAESEFAALCAESGIVRNKSTQDRTGWDYLIEFERPSNAHVPHDQREGGLTARVQIKSKQGRSASTYLKLSNALTFAKEPDPCFVVLFWRSPDDTESGIYARHFDKDLISSTLRRAREADRDRRSDLHRIRVNLPFADRDVHTDDLIEWIRSELHMSGHAYAAEKARLNETIGFEDENRSFTMTLPLAEIPAMIEHSVGLRESFEVENINFPNRRFGILAHTPAFDGKPDKMTLVVNPEPAQLTIMGNSRVIVVDGEFRAFNWPGLPVENFRASFKSRFITATFTDAPQIGIHYSYGASDAEELPALLEAVQFLIAARCPLTMSLSVNGGFPLESEPVQIEVDHDEWLDWLEGAIGLLRSLCRPSDHPRLSLDDIVMAASRIAPVIYWMNNGSLTVEVDWETPPDDLSPCKAFLYYAYAEVGDTFFATIAQRPCVTQTEGEKCLTLTFGAPVVLDKVAAVGPLSQHLPEVRRKFSVFMEMLGKGVATVNEGDVLTATGTGGISCT